VLINVHLLVNELYEDELCCLGILRSEKLYILPDVSEKPIPPFQRSSIRNRNYLSTLPKITKQRRSRVDLYYIIDTRQCLKHFFLWLLVHLSTADYLLLKKILT